MPASNIQRELASSFKERILHRIFVLIVGLLLLLPAHAAILTVGTGGNFDNIQAAINAALGSKAADEIRVGRGTYVENLIFFPSGSGEVLTISGGWNTTFDTQGAVPSVVDGDLTGSVLGVDLGSGDGLTLNRLRFQNGKANFGAGIAIFQGGSSSVDISDCEIENNIAEDTRTSSGGVDLYAEDDASFSMTGSKIAGNQTICTGVVDCRAGGITIGAFGNAQIIFSHNLVQNNSVSIATGSALTGGADILIGDSAELTIEDNQFVGNSISGTTAAGGVGLALGGGTITARRNYVSGNTASIPLPEFIPQLSFSKGGDGPAILSDSVIVDSDTLGLRASTGGGGNPTLYLVNLTIANHVGTGVRLSKFATGGEINMSNSISVNSSTNAEFDAGVTESDNLLTGDAGFVNPAAGNYRLAVGSPAINAGNNAPPGGLGLTDIDGNPRIFDVDVDQGAYENQSTAFLLDGFEGP